MNLGGFASGGGSVTSVVLYLEFTVASGYAGSNPILVNGVSTGIIPVNGDNSRTASINITGGSYLIDTWPEVSSLTVTFNNNDGPPGKNVSFDYAYLVISSQEVGGFSMDVGDDPENGYSGAPSCQW
jgi:hypothetical protein